MLIGDVVETEIYGPVIVKKVFRSVREMVANGYAIPTGANDTGFQINGKVVFGTRRTYAAAPHDVRGRNCGCRVYNTALGGGRRRSLGGVRVFCLLKNYC